MCFGIRRIIFRALFHVASTATNVTPPPPPTPTPTLPSPAFPSPAPSASALLRLASRTTSRTSTDPSPGHNIATFFPPSFPSNISLSARSCVRSPVTKSSPPRHARIRFPVLLPRPHSK
eukprot:1209-Pelagococcus_subviridis.AAC.5